MKNVLLLSLLFIGTKLFSQTADDIISKHINATGGTDKWTKVTALKLSGVYVMGPGMFPPVTTVLVSKPFVGYYSDFSWQGMTNKVAMRADSGWTYNPFSGKRESDPMNTNDVRETTLDADPQGLLVNYKQKGYSVDFLGMDDMDGTDVFKLRLTNKQGDMVYYFIDAESYYILKTSKRIKLADKEIKSYTVYSDFRQTDFGITVPFSIQNVDENGSEQGGPVNFSKVEVNPVVDATLFNKP